MPSRQEPLNHVAVVLKQPHFSENVGAAARAACNMGISRLIVVDPVRYEPAKAMRLATHVAAPLLDKALFVEDLGKALVDFNYVVGTTARMGGQRRVVVSPRQLGQRLPALLPENRIALLFGPEDRGLTNADLRRCHLLVNIATADFSSINLAQAVMILCYEVFGALQKKPAAATSPRLASRHELDGMFAHLSETLIKISYLNPENPEYWMSRLRDFANRLGLRASEVSMIRGICRQIDWYGRSQFEKASKGGTGKK